MKASNELEKTCRSLIAQSGIDGRTSYFARIIRSPESITHTLQDLTRLRPEQVRRVLQGFASERYAEYCERRACGFEFDFRPITFILSQGYKRGLVWQGIPLGKTCWDISIYQQLLQELRPKTLIEFGTGLGASALFFLDNCKIFGLDTRIITIDKNSEDVNPRVFEEALIRFIQGDVKEVATLLPIAELASLPHPWLVVEDCHREIRLILAHVLPLMVSGDYLVIEDIGTSAGGGLEIHRAIETLPVGTILVDTFYTDMFGRNLTCAPDSIFKRM